MVNELTRERALQLVEYDPATGAFRWLVNRRGSVKAGDVAGSRRGDGYVRIKLDQHAVWAHRLAWLIVHGEWPHGEIDHINGDPGDNRLSNLRDVSRRMNAQNERRGRRRKQAGTLLGAHWCSTWKRWKSSINVGGKLKHIGWFDTEQQAHAAYVAAKRKHHAGCTV